MLKNKAIRHAAWLKSISPPKTGPKKRKKTPYVAYPLRCPPPHVERSERSRDQQLVMKGLGMGRIPFVKKFPITGKNVGPYLQQGGTEEAQEHVATHLVPMTGYYNKFGKFERVPEMTPDIIVPDLKGFKLKPYVSYKAETIHQSKFTENDLFQRRYAEPIATYINDCKKKNIEPQRPIEILKTIKETELLEELQPPKMNVGKVVGTKVAPTKSVPTKVTAIKNAALSATSRLNPKQVLNKPINWLKKMRK